MAAAILPVRIDELLESSDDTAPRVVRERRELERAIIDWEQETGRLGRAPTLMTLNVSEMTSEKWAYRFIIAADPVAERCTLLFYGARFAALMGLPEKPDISVPMVEQIPPRYVPVFTTGCIDRDRARCTRQNARCGREGGWAARALPDSVYPFQSQTEWSATPGFRRFQLSCRRGRKAGLRAFVQLRDLICKSHSSSCYSL